MKKSHAIFYADPAEIERVKGQIENAHQRKLVAEQKSARWLMVANDIEEKELPKLRMKLKDLEGKGGL